MFSRLALSAALVLVMAGCAKRPNAEILNTPVASAQATFQVEQVVSGLDHPWGMAFLPDGDLLVTERSGNLRRVRDGLLEEAPIKGVPEVVAAGQGGLLDVALHPQYADNGWLYLSYAGPIEGGASTHVARARLDGDVLTDVEVILRANSIRSGGYHFGSRLVFDRQGYLFVTAGERGDDQRAQNLGEHGGSVLRLNDDGSVPADNPFVGQAGAMPEIYTYGNRNPQGMAIHPETGEVWIHEHGPKGGDEINLLRAGANYGWPLVTYGMSYGGLPIGEGTHKEGTEQPLYYWVPSIAPSGMAFYQGDAFPEWRGDLLVGALSFALLARLELDGTQVLEEERLLEGELGRVRDVEIGPDGFVYLLTDSSDGWLVRLTPAEG